MRMLHVGYFDAAGAGQHMSEAVVEHSVHASQTAFLADGVATSGCAVRPTTFEDPLVQAACEAADVVFLHVGVKDGYKAGRPDVDLLGEPALARFHGKAVLWINGSRNVREHAEAYQREYAGFRKVATNADVAEMFGAAWMPCAIAPVLDKGLVRWEMPPHAGLRTVSHCPTDAFLKNVADLRDACNVREYAWHRRTIFGQPHMDSIQQRMQAHVTFDHMQGYFGVCAIEAAAIGMPVIVHLGPASLRALDGFGGRPPWYEASSEAELGSLLDSLSDDDLRLKGERNRAWYEDGFTNRHKANRLIGWLEKGA